MSKSIRPEQVRRIAELESLVAGLAHHIARLEEDLHKCAEEREKLRYQHGEAVRKLERLKAEE